MYRSFLASTGALRRLGFTGEHRTATAARHERLGAVADVFHGYAPRVLDIFRFTYPFTWCYGIIQLPLHSVCTCECARSTCSTRSFVSTNKRIAALALGAGVVRTAPDSDRNPASRCLPSSPVGLRACACPLSRPRAAIAPALRVARRPIGRCSPFRSESGARFCSHAACAQRACGMGKIGADACPQ